VQPEINKAVVRELEKQFQVHTEKIVISHVSRLSLAKDIQNRCENSRNNKTCRFISVGLAENFPKRMERLKLN
jgi:hypothetical protein